jgi:D-alanine transfer protein
MRGHVLLRWIVLGVVAAIVVMAAYAWHLYGPMTDADSNRLYDYMASDGRSESVNFVLSNKSEDGILCFGSSEWSVPEGIVPEVPQAVFGEQNMCGVNMTYIGQAFDQDLWNAIALGAYTSESAQSKVVLVVSPQWFFKNNGSQSKFSSKFSYTLYTKFCSNSNISDETKDYVRQRVTELGVDSDKIAAANHDTYQDVINDITFQVNDNLLLREKLESVVDSAPEKSDLRKSYEETGEQTGEPDWNALLAQADADGAARCTNNDYGIYDDYWNKYGENRGETGQNFHEADAEYADFQCFLDICKECGVEPLIVILPVHGQWYDLNGVSTDERQYYYDRIRSICDENGVAYADFSSCEYEKYFFCDTSHPGWRGWVHIEEAVYDFVNNQDDQWLGGSIYGTAEGASAS